MYFDVGILSRDVEAEAEAEAVEARTFFRKRKREHVTVVEAEAEAEARTFSDYKFSTLIFLQNVTFYCIFMNKFFEKL